MDLTITGEGDREVITNRGHHKTEKSKQQITNLEEYELHNCLKSPLIYILVSD